LVGTFLDESRLLGRIVDPKIKFQKRITMNNGIRFVLLLAIMSGMLLTACSSGSGTQTLSNTNWKLVSYGPANAQVPAAEGIETSILFSTDGKISGNLGCNGFGGDYKQDGSQLVLGPLMSTLMACPEPQMSQETGSFSILNGTVDFLLGGDNLIITGMNGDQLILIRQ